MRKLVLLTDMGHDSYDLTQLRSILLQESERLMLVELGNSIANYDIIEAYFFLNGVWNNFENDEIFIVSVGISEPNGAGLLYAKIENKIIIAPDNGLLPLFADNFPISYYSFNQSNSLIKTLNYLVKNNFELDENWTKVEKPITKILDKPRIDGNILRIGIIHIDKFGNIYLPVSKMFFEQFIGDEPFSIRIKRDEIVYQLKDSLSDVADGDLAVYFDEQDINLMISVKKGHAASLLGLQRGKYIHIEKGTK